MFEDFSNVYSVNSIKEFTAIYNKVRTAKSIVIYGNNFEAYELASAIRTLSDKFGNDSTKIYLLEPPPSEFLRSFGEPIHKSIKAMMFVNRINVLSDYSVDATV